MKTRRYFGHVIPEKYVLMLDDLQLVVLDILIKAGRTGLLTDELLEQIHAAGFQCRHPAPAVWFLRNVAGFSIPDATPEWRTFRGRDIKCGRYVLQDPPHKCFLPVPFDEQEGQPQPGNTPVNLLPVNGVPIQLDLFPEKANDAPQTQEATP